MKPRTVFPIIAWLFLCSPLATWAQPRIYGQATHLPRAIWRTVLLEHYRGDRFESVDSAKLAADGLFAFAPKEYEDGLYRLGFRKEGHPVEFYVSRADTALEFSFDYEMLAARVVRPTLSVENQAFAEFKILHQQLDKAVSTALGNWRAAASPARAKTAWQSVDSLLATGSEIADKLKKTYPGTYTAEVLSGFLWKKTPGKTPQDPAEAFARYELDNLAWKNPALANNKYLQEALLKLSAHLAAENRPLEKYMDASMRYAPQAAPRTATFLFAFALQLAVDQRNDPAATYLLNSYQPGCSDDDPFNPRQLVDAMKASAPGQTAKDILLADTAGRMITFAEAYGRHEATLLVFWRTTCEHCRDMLPKLEALVKKWGDGRFGVFAVSIDKRREDWSVYLKPLGHSLLQHVWCPKPFFQDLLQFYPVSGTPYIALVDRNGKILHRLVSADEVGQLVEKAFGK